MCESHDAEKSDDECHGREADRERRARNGGCRDSRSEKKTAAATKWAKLRCELEATIAMSDAYARNERKAHTNMITVGHHNVVEVLEIRPKREKLRIDQIA